MKKAPIGDVLVTDDTCENPYTYSGPFRSGLARALALRNFENGIPPADLQLWYAPADGGAMRINRQRCGLGDHVMRLNPMDVPLSENDLNLAREVEPKTKAMARRDYFQRRQAMYVWRQNFREAAAHYASFHFEMDNKPLDERIEDSRQLKQLWDLAYEAYDSYQACLQHFHNAQADYRAVGGKV